MGNREEIQKLLDAYLVNRANREEFDKLLFILSTLDDAEFSEIVRQALADDAQAQHADFIDNRVEQLYPEILTKVRESTQEYDEPANDAKPVIRWVWWKVAVAAASFLLLLWAGIEFRQTDVARNEIAAGITIDEIMAGSNRATLTLADGRRVNLSDSQQGISTGNSIRYLDGTEVMDSSANSKMDFSDVQLLTLATPNGGQYQLSLPDGSRVWLNAASSITYPSAFTGGKREVTLRGEAYFEVTKDAAKPFIVDTEMQRVKVLGTSFNINAYSNENLSKTTLLTGSVRVNARSDNDDLRNEKVLKPGQQSIIGDNGRTVAVLEVDPTTAVAWKNGLFDFHGLNIEEAMKQIERWYDVRVTYKGPKPAGYLGGKMSRGVRLSTFLEFLEKDFRIQSEIMPDRTLVLYIPTDKQNSDL
ncbi:FecR family protein [Dyadobacter aurulentus]|uniref:FecR family protein n=1 Tax=Dyadobacter sp. UC 10 TaxID=2605428 RepID=UPI0011F40459|nr:FecR domain-containing protein [Dyadobacter sp. UC 10]KAA0992092.1 DUF4974 domain-containing protein [Dyadobacter sp. UC 10]